MFFFCKFNQYEEDKQDTDIQSYIDNSSARIDGLLRSASGDSDVEEEVNSAAVQRYFEEQTNESSDPNLQLESTGQY